MHFDALHILYKIAMRKKSTSLKSLSDFDILLDLPFVSQLKTHL